MSDMTEKLQQALSRLHRLDSGLNRTYLQSSYSQEDILRSLIGSNLLFVLLKAVEARKLAASYRDFDGRICGSLLYSTTRTVASSVRNKYKSR